MASSHTRAHVYPRSPSYSKAASNEAEHIEAPFQLVTIIILRTWLYAPCANQVDRVVAVSMDAEALVRKGMGRRHCNECDKGFNIAHIDEVGAEARALF